VTNHRVYPFLSDEILTVFSVDNVGSKSKPRWNVRCSSARGVDGVADSSEFSLAHASLAERAQGMSSEQFQNSLTVQEHEEVMSIAGSPRDFWSASTGVSPVGRESVPAPREIEHDVKELTGRR